MIMFWIFSVADLLPGLLVVLSFCFSPLAPCPLPFSRSFNYHSHHAVVSEHHAGGQKEHSETESCAAELPSAGDTYTTPREFREISCSERTREKERERVRERREGLPPYLDALPAVFSA